MGIEAGKTIKLINIHCDILNMHESKDAYQAIHFEIARMCSFIINKIKMIIKYTENNQYFLSNTAIG